MRMLGRERAGLGIVAAAEEVPVVIALLGPDDDDAAIAGRGDGGAPDVAAGLGDVERFARLAVLEVEKSDLIASAGGQELGEVLGLLVHGGHQLRPSRLVPDRGDPGAGTLRVGGGRGEVLLLRPFKQRSVWKNALDADAIIQERHGRAIGQPIDGNREFSLLGLDRESGAGDVLERHDHAIGRDGRAGCARSCRRLGRGLLPCLGRGLLLGLGRGLASWPLACFLALAAAFFAAAVLRINRLLVFHESRPVTMSPSRNRRPSMSRISPLSSRDPAAPILRGRVADAQDQTHGDDVGIEGLGRRLRAPGPAPGIRKPQR